MLYSWVKLVDAFCNIVLAFSESGRVVTLITCIMISYQQTFKVHCWIGHTLLLRKEVLPRWLS